MPAIARHASTKIPAKNATLLTFIVPPRSWKQDFQPINPVLGEREYGTFPRQKPENEPFLHEIGVRFDATSVRYALNAGASPASAPSAIIARGVSTRAE